MLHQQYTSVVTTAPAVSAHTGYARFQILVPIPDTSLMEGGDGEKVDPFSIVVVVKRYVYRHTYTPPIYQRVDTTTHVLS